MLEISESNESPLFTVQQRTNRARNANKQLGLLCCMLDWPWSPARYHPFESFASDQWEPTNVAQNKHSSLEKGRKRVQLLVCCVRFIATVCCLQFTVLFTSTVAVCVRCVNAKNHLNKPWLNELKNFIISLSQSILKFLYFYHRWNWALNVFRQGLKSPLKCERCRPQPSVHCSKRRYGRVRKLCLR